VPDRSRRELRELTRYRTSLIRERSAEVHRLQKLLEGCNIKLSDVATDVLGASGRAILHDLIAGQTNSAVLASHARGRMKAKQAALEEALQGSVGPHQRFLLRQQLDHIEHLEALITRVGDEIAQRLDQIAATATTPAAADALERLDGIPGVGRRTAEILVAEIGLDMSCFPTSANLASWAGLCPGNHQSAGKQKSGRTRKGNTWLYTALVEAAQATTRTDTYLAAQYHRLAARRGAQRATVAVAHSILVMAYHLLRDGGTYQDLGPTYFDARNRTHTRHRLVTRLQQLGYAVQVQDLTTA
jgi:transposase